MRHRSVLPIMLVSTFAGLAACGDDITDLDVMDSAEAEAVMRSAESLPLLPAFLEAADTADGYRRATLFRARELWDAGVATDDTRSAARRRLAVGYAVPVLLEAVPAGDWEVARERIDDWMATANAMLRHLSIPAVEAQLEAATVELRRSDQAQTDRARIYHLLLAGSELVETTPRFVARSMARDAEAAVERASARTDPAVPSATLERGTRLKDWAVRAVEEGDHLLAIQRAYYAIQLLEE